MNKMDAGGTYLNACNEAASTERYLNSADINIMPGYSIEVYVYGLDSPNNIIFTEDGSMLISESGVVSGNPRVLKLVNERFEVLAENFAVPITGINYLNGILYITHRGIINRILMDGTRQNIIMGLPSNGDHYTSPVAISPDNKLYFGQGTVTNSGVVGEDNEWLTTSPLLCDYPGDYIMLNGQNFETKNLLTDLRTNEIVSTGAFSPYGSENNQYEVKKGFKKGSGSILRSNPDGTELEQYAWGFRNPNYLRFDNSGRLFAANNGFKNKGSRPIANAPDEFFYVLPGVWYGWPDYCGGEPVTLPRFRPEGGRQPEFIIKNPPSDQPKPYVTFPSNSNIKGFDFNYNSYFGPYGDVYIAEFGSSEFISDGSVTVYAGTGHRISKISMSSRTMSTFAINKSGFPSSISKEGGFERPTDVKFGRDGAMYVLDSGISIGENPDVYVPNTGVIWKITRKNS